MGGKSANKAGYFDKLKGLLEEYKSIFIVSVDNVSSQQMHEIRQSLRGEGVVLMGKNTMVRFLGEPMASQKSRDTTLTNLPGSPCPQDLHPRCPRVRASAPLRQGQRRFRLHQR